MPADHVVIENTGPITRFEIPVPIEGGLVLFRGRNGLGKSTALDAISETLHQTNGLEKRRGAKSGFVEGFGMRLTVGELTTRKGALDVYEIEGLDASRAIDPRIKDPRAADRERILTLCSLMNVKPDASKFAPLVGGAEALAKLATPATLARTSMPEIAEGLKEDLERRARTLQDEQNKLEGEAGGYRNAIGDTVLGGPGVVADEEILNAAHLDAVKELSALESRRDTVASMRTKYVSATAALDELRARPAIDEAEAQQAVEAARAEEGRAREQLGECTRAVSAQEDTKIAALRTADEGIAAVDAAKSADVRAAELVLEQAKRAREDAIKAAREAKSDVERAADASITASKLRVADAMSAATRAARAVADAQARIDSARQRREAITNAERDLAVAGGTPADAPTEEAIEAARAAVGLASKAKDLGAVIREKRALKLKADACSQKAAKLQEHIDDLRRAARDVWSPVFKAVEPILPPGMDIFDGRLRQRQGEEIFNFSDLSFGTKVRIIVGACAESMHRVGAEIAAKTGKPAPLPILVFGQEYGEGLDPVNKEIVHEVARQNRVAIYTGECDGGELRAEVFEPSTNGAKA